MRALKLLVLGCLFVCEVSASAFAGQFLYFGEANKSLNPHIKPKTAYLQLYLRDPDWMGVTDYAYAGISYFPTHKKGLGPRLRDIKTLSYKYALSTGEMYNDEFYFVVLLDTNSDGYSDEVLRIYARKDLSSYEDYGEIVTVSNLMKDRARRVQYGHYATLPSSTWVTVTELLASRGDARVHSMGLMLQSENIRPNDNVVIIGDAGVRIHALKIGSDSMSVKDMLYTGGP